MSNKQKQSVIRPFWEISHSRDEHREIEEEFARRQEELDKEIAAYYALRISDIESLGVDNDIVFAREHVCLLTVNLLKGAGWNVEVHNTDGGFQIIIRMQESP
jgi:hypothetical protein